MVDPVGPIGGLEIARLHADIDGCRICEAAGYSIKKPLSMSRGGGSTGVMAIGIAPGRMAISAEKAFAGNSMSRLLRWFSEAGFPMTEEQCREALYFTSIIKCAATPDTSKNRLALWGRCGSFLWRQITILQPKLILLLGQEPLAMVRNNRRLRARDTVGQCFSTAQLFEGELFPPVDSTITWLVMPHPSGLSRTMNDPDTHSMVIRVLRNNLLAINFTA